MTTEMTAVERLAVELEQARAERDAALREVEEVTYALDAGQAARIAAEAERDAARAERDEARQIAALRQEALDACIASENALRSAESAALARLREVEEAGRAAEEAMRVSLSTMQDPMARMSRVCAAGLVEPACDHDALRKLRAAMERIQGAHEGILRALSQAPAAARVKLVPGLEGECARCGAVVEVFKWSTHTCPAPAEPKEG